MSAHSSPYFEVQLIAILITLFVGLTALLFFLNCLLTICNQNNDDHSPLIEDGKYFELIRCLIERQEEIQRQCIERERESLLFSSKLKLPCDRFPSPVQTFSERSSNAEMNFEESSVKKLKTPPNSPVESAQQECHADRPLKTETYNKLAKLRDDLAQFKVDHNIQICNNQNMNTQKKGGNESKTQKEEIVMRNPVNKTTSAESNHRRTWTEFQNLQIDNLQKFAKRASSTHNGRSTQALCDAQKPRKSSIQRSNSKRKYSRETIV